MKRDLTHFLIPSPERLTILTVDSTLYLEKLCLLYPAATIHAVTSIAEVSESPRFLAYSERIMWHILDWRLEELPFAEESFDRIIAETVFEYAYEPYDTLMRLNRLLEPTGNLYTLYSNIRYHAVLESLRQGDYPVRGRQLYAKPEVVRLLNDTLFKEISFAPAERDDDMTASRFWAEQGFVDFSEDLATRIWMIKASRSTAQVSNLKSFFTPLVRRELARLIHRIEYDVERQKNLAELQSFCSREGIFDEYLADFIEESCTHAERVKAILAEYAAHQN